MRLCGEERGGDLCHVHKYFGGRLEVTKREQGAATSVVFILELSRYGIHLASLPSSGQC